jgi:excisionase family DNA binding protein
MCPSSSSTNKSQRDRQSRPERFGIPAAAEYLSISERHVRRLVFERRLAHYKVGSRIVISVSDCDVLLEQSRREAMR